MDIPAHDTKFNQDPFGRTISYLRLSVTDRCNLRCCYCMPAEGIPLSSHSEILSYEELLRISRVAVGLGIEKIRVTGGEPFARKGLLGFLAKLGSLPGLMDLTLTTNGLLLEDNAAQLKSAGVQRLNVSVDSLCPDTYTQITRGGDLKRVISGLEAAEAAGLKLKLNMVVLRGINDNEVLELASLTLNRPWSIRFIEYMPTIKEQVWRQRVVPGREILERLRAAYRLEPVSSSRLCGPARVYRVPGAAGSIGIITPMTDHFCSNCNRIRVTAKGLAKSCLLSAQATDLKPALLEGDLAIQKALFGVICGKGRQHSFLEEGQSFQMVGIGG